MLSPGKFKLSLTLERTKVEPEHALTVTLKVKLHVVRDSLSLACSDSMLHCGSTGAEAYQFQTSPAKLFDTLHKPIDTPLVPKLARDGQPQVKFTLICYDSH